MGWTAVGTGAISEAMLDERSSTDAALLLSGIKGIGPWTAAAILLRGLGRLDAFPGNDSSVAANLALVAGERVDPDRSSRRWVRSAYFYLLLARLESRDEIGGASDVTR